ncbi:MAG: tellurite resistance protein TerC [Actinomycetota bacterium]|nr:tellurite resistance protein TerC [Actinomycetota bacterium]
MTSPITVEWWAWVAVIAFILAMLAVDLLFFHREAHEVSVNEAAVWSGIWIGLSLCFGGIVWATLGGQAAGEYMSGYLIEKSLSVDNLFVFALLLNYFAVPLAHQHRLLYWGVLGALVARAAFIFAGVALLDAFHWTIYVFGALLVITGARMATHSDTEVHPDRNPVLNLLRRAVPITDEYHEQHFFVRREGRRWATPLLAVLVVIETTDVVFAIDSIPAIFAITRNTFLVFTSNAFAILGLRALYFLLAGFLGRLAYLNVGLAAVLVFVGVKMLLTDVYHVPVWASLLTIAAMIGVSVVISLRRA